jgi:hypothetical protein
MKKVETFEQACIALRIDPAKCLPEVIGVPEKHQQSIVAHTKLVIIAEALNEGWVPDWSDNDQRKYYPFFDLSSGSGLSFYDYGYNYSGSYVGSRLCFKSGDLATYAGKQFTELYKQAWLI